MRDLPLCIPGVSWKSNQQRPHSWISFLVSLEPFFHVTHADCFVALCSLVLNLMFPSSSRQTVTVYRRTTARVQPIKPVWGRWNTERIAIYKNSTRKFSIARPKLQSMKELQAHRSDLEFLAASHSISNRISVCWHKIDAFFAPVRNSTQSVRSSERNSCVCVYMIISLYCYLCRGLNVELTIWFKHLPSGERHGDPIE